MDERKFRLIMVGIGAINLVLLSVIIFYPMTHTHEDTLTIQDHYITPGVYHIDTDKVNLTEHRYFEDVLVKGHTYQVRWVDGLRYDRILRYEEVEP